VTVTEELMKQVKRFVSAVNKSMDFVRIEQFIFEESDYEMISMKEVKEIRDIFKAFDIKIKEITTKVIN